MNFSKVKFGIVLVFLLSSKLLLAQNTGVSDEARTPDASAVLDVYSTSKGLLVPRVTEAQRTAIATPALGLLVYQTNGTTPGFYYYTGTTWTPIASGSGSRWSLVPNTTDIYYASGFVGVGVTNPGNQFVVNSTLEIRRPTVTGAVSQLLFTNTSGSGDFRIGSDGGDFFWQGGGSRSLQMGSFHATVIYGDRQAGGFPGFIPSTTYPNRSVVISSSRIASIPLSIQGASASQTANLTEWLNSAGTAINVVNNAGNLGLGVIAPTQKLDVAGNFKLTGAFMPNDQPGTTGYVLQSAGANAAPVWADLSVATSALSWTLGGNNLSGIRNLGTTTNFDLPLITNNTEKMRISATGNIGVGATTFDATNPEKFLVNAGTTTSVNAFVSRGNINKYFQTNIQNLSTGNQASSDIVATANNGTETTFFVNLGINGSGFVYDPANNLIETGGANDGYLLSAGNNFHIVNSNATRDMIFTTGGTAAVNEAMRLTAARNLGLGVTAPSQKLDVAGNFRLTGAFMPNGNAGTAGQVLQSAGVNASPVWVAAGAFSGWALGGNSVAALNTLGTTTAFDLPFITSNTEKMRILSTGNVGINTATPTEKLEINGNLKINAAAATTPRRLVFANTGADPDAVIEVRPGGATEQQEMLFYVGNDPANAFGPDRIRMVAEEIRFQNFNSDANSTLANAESQPAGLNTRMIITPAGNVGIETTTPNSTLSVDGSLSMAVTTETGNYTLTAADHVVIHTGIMFGATFTLPAANTCRGRIYRVVNHGSTTVTLSANVITAVNTSTNSVAAGNAIEIISDGTNWRRIGS
ncbi:autotransporter outer membrane beta-barrel domain-containing protein [Adhaeribacter pallidiroseus]|uniref:Uncharacterized protein n=1 Tax=Adhaeribacter pallidiroseus TaxID=2072847 RepID=A0A369QM30_9BACT|nr:hypothetical protein [Adhaeribacter pallidiroseus]RDC63889.1 hypothetical protein AHMF7616_02498 [Adhaeribacter pallidiroseus]